MGFWGRLNGSQMNKCPDHWPFITVYGKYFITKLKNAKCAGHDM